MYTLLRKQSMVPREPSVLLECPTTAELQRLLPCDGSLWAVDLETTGTRAELSDNVIVGLGFANAAICGYINIPGLDTAARDYLITWLKQAKLTAFNVLFDGTFLQVFTGQWLNWVGCSFGLFKGLSSESYPGQTWGLETAQRDVLGWNVSNKDAMKAALLEHGLAKADMAKLPFQVLSKYCASDADAAWQLWHYLQDVASRYPQVVDHHSRLFMVQVQLLAEQQLRGVQVDVALLQECHTNLLTAIDAKMKSFLGHPDVVPHVAAYNDKVRAAWLATEPPKTTAKGEISKRWEMWRDREARVLTESGFNPNSKPQLADLFYGSLGYKPFHHTPTGKPVVDRKVLPSLGVPGKLLAEYNLLVKRRGYVERMMERSVTGYAHPQFNSMGTVTGRLGGSGGLNWQQMPKVPDFLACVKARPGMALVQADCSALEPTILADFSQDKALLALYGPNAKPNDIYLYTASKIPALGKEILEYYDPENPTPEGIAAAKKHCKKQRSISKLVTLSANYGAGAPTIHETLTLGGIQISLAEVRRIHQDYWKLYGGVKRFEATLKDIWADRGGHVPSLLGLPLCVDRGLIQDILNRVIQASGHQFLQLWIAYIQQLRVWRGVEMYPWLLDEHDATTWECPADQVDAVQQIFADALVLANSEVDMTVVIKAPPMVAENLAEIKTENYAEWKEQHVVGRNKKDSESLGITPSSAAG